MTITTTTDERSLAAVQRDHGPALFAFLIGLTQGDRQRAEDLLQETLVRAWQHPEAFHTRHESMRPWLFTVARRLAIDARRSRLARPAEVGDAALDATPEPGDAAERAVTALDVREAVRTLSTEHRAVLVQLYFRGRSVTEAAQALGIPAGTVKSRSYYALRALARALPGYAVPSAAPLSACGGPVGSGLPGLPVSSVNSVNPTVESTVNPSVSASSRSSSVSRASNDGVWASSS